MSYTPSTLVACPNIQEDLDRLFGANPARYYIEPVPFTQFLMSPANRSGLDMVVSPGNAKTRTVTAVYQPRILSSEVQTNVSSYCTASTERGTTSTEYSIDTSQNLFLEQTFDVDNLADACRDNADWFNDQILRMVVAMDARVNEKNATQAAALLGGWSSDVSGISNITVTGTPTRIQVRTEKTASDSDPFYQTYEAVQAAAEASHFGQFITIGGFQLHQFNRLMEHACCANSGVDVASLQAEYGFASLRDRNVASAAGGNAYSWAISNGALQVLYYNRWSGLFEQRDANQSYGVINSPSTGMAYDLVIKHDCGTIDVTLTATTKLVALPDDMFQTGDHMDGVKGFAAIQVDNS
jgi:hypothetical protein